MIPPNRMINMRNTNSLRVIQIGIAAILVFNISLWVIFLSPGLNDESDDCHPCKLEDLENDLDYPGNHLAEPYFIQENQKLCNNTLENPILILVPSRLRDFDKRTVIRETWANLDSYLRRPLRSYILAFTVSIISTSTYLLLKICSLRILGFSRCICNFQQCIFNNLLKHLIRFDRNLF